MRNQRWRTPLLIATLPALYATACLAVPGFARAALNAFSIPAMLRLHRLTAPVPFPVAELLALSLMSALLIGLGHAIALSIKARKLLPLRRWLAAVLVAALLPAVGLTLLWTPALALPAETVPAPDDRQLARLCENLIDALNAAPLSFPAPAESLSRAPKVAGLKSCAIKAVRWPEWMRAAKIWGLFVPLTGEALVDASEPAPLVPFTAVHELMHLTGIADEGAANIAAWNRCMEAGDAFADSARLWALRYALGLLRRQDESEWQRVRGKMEDALARIFRECGSEADPAPPRRLALTRGDYAALACYLAGSIPPPSPQSADSARG